MTGDLHWDMNTNPRDTESTSWQNLNMFLNVYFLNSQWTNHPFNTIITKNYPQSSKCVFLEYDPRDSPYSIITHLWYVYATGKLSSSHFDIPVLFSNPKSDGLVRHIVFMGQVGSCPSVWGYFSLPPYISVVTNNFITLPYPVLAKTCTILHVPKRWFLHLVLTWLKTLSELL